MSSPDDNNPGTASGDRLALPLDATPRQLHTKVVDEPPTPDDHAVILARGIHRSPLQHDAVLAASRLAEQDGAQVIGFDITEGDEPG